MLLLDAGTEASAECSRDKPPFSFVRGQDSTMWDIIWVSPQGHRSVSVSRHFFLQAPQCLCRIVGSHTRWELTTWADFQLCLHRLLMSTVCKSSHNGFLDVSRSNGGLSISGCIGQLSVLLLRLWRSTGFRSVWNITLDVNIFFNHCELNEWWWLSNLVIYLAVVETNEKK